MARATWTRKVVAGVLVVVGCGCSQSLRADALGRAFGHSAVAATGNESTAWHRAPGVPNQAYAGQARFTGPVSPNAGYSAPQNGSMPNVVVAPRGPVEGSDREHPVMRCGPRDSYAFIANDFRCADGSNPFRGNLGAGARARRGNVGANSTGHIIDLYVVPCPEGPREIYVDMYGCPDEEGGSGNGGVRTL